jgi:hypothetical protein
MERNSAEMIPASIERSPYIQFNWERDLPLMLAVRNATFISHRQLSEQIRAGGIETGRRSFNWRIERLVRAGLADKLPPQPPYVGPVYTITRAGLACLESCGQGLVSLTSESRTLAKPSQMRHYLELAEIRAAIRRAGVLREWAGDLEVRSINQSIDFPLAKDYDAIVDVECEANTFRIAVEYERSLKSSDRYRELISSIASERQVCLVLYLTSSVDLLYQLKAEFDRQEFPLALVPSHSFRINPLTARLYLTRTFGAQRATLPALLRTLLAGQNGAKAQ